MAGIISVRLRGLDEAVLGLRATRSQIVRAARNTGGQTATAARRETVKLIKSGTKLKAKVIRDRIGIHRTRPEEFEQQGIAAYVTPRGPRRGAVPIAEYKPKAVNPQNPKYRRNRTRKAVQAKLFVDEPNQIIDGWFINPVHDKKTNPVDGKKTIYRKRNDGQHIPVLYGPAIYQQVERIQPTVQRTAEREYAQRFVKALERQTRRNR